MIRILLLGLMVLGAQGAERPNFVFILADDLGINDLGCYGRAEHRTPHLDRLAAQGTRFTSAYCAQPICSPSRAAILTGKHPARLHLTTFLPGRPDGPAQALLHPPIEKQLPLGEITLAERLKAAGYATACIGKWHLGGKGFLPGDQGFDVVYGGMANTKPSESEGGKGEQDLTTHAIEFMRAQTNRPFFLYLPHNNPHIPYAARAHRVAANGAALEPVYAAVIEELDDGVGRLLTALEELKLAEKTVVVFTSDNGGLHVPEGPHPVITHNAPFRAGKGFLYEGGLRIPLIVRWPGKVPAGRIADGPVVNTDWTPTLCRLAGVEVAGLDGADITPTLLGGDGKSGRRFHWHFPHYTNQGSQPAGALREGDWKLIEHYEDRRLELFNVAKDSGETNNLAGQESARAMAMQKALGDWRVSIGAQTNTSNPKFNPALHRGLYVETNPSMFNAQKAAPEGRQEMIEWRRRMNAAIQPK